MLYAVNVLRECGGGLVVVADGAVLAKVELPLAGLMSRKSVMDLAKETHRLNQVVQELGIDHAAKGLSTTGLALTVIPELRMSDLRRPLRRRLTDVLACFHMTQSRRLIAAALL